MEPSSKDGKPSEKKNIAERLPTSKLQRVFNKRLIKVGQIETNTNKFTNKISL